MKRVKKLSRQTLLFWLFFWKCSGTNALGKTTKLSNPTHGLSHHIEQHHHHPIVGQQQQQCMVAGQPSSAVFSDWSQTGRRPATRPNILFGFLSTSSRIVSNFHASCVCLHFYILCVILFRILRGNLKTSPKPTGNLILLNMISKDKVDRLHSQVDHVCPDKSKFELLEAERSILGKKDGRKCFLATGKSQTAVKIKDTDPVFVGSIQPSLNILQASHHAVSEILWWWMISLMWRKRPPASPDCLLLGDRTTFVFVNLVEYPFNLLLTNLCQWS